MSIICDPSGEWSLSKEDISKIDKKVAGMLAQKIEKNSVIDLPKFINSIFNEVLEKTGDQQKALAVARLVPSSIEISKSVYDSIRLPLREKKLLDPGALEDVIISFNKSIDNVTKYLNDYRSTLAPKIQDPAAQVNGIISVQPRPKAIVNDIDSAGGFLQVPADVLTTSGEEVREERDLKWYYDFIKLLNEESIVPDEDGTIYYRGNKIQLMLTSGYNLPEDKLYPDDRKKADIKKMISKQMYIAFTNPEGDFIYFDDQYNLTGDTGNIIYFPLRTIPSFRIENGKRIFNINESIKNNKIQPLASIINGKKRQGITITEEQLVDQINGEYNTLQTMVEYLTSKGNFKKKLKLNLSYTTHGFLYREFSNKKPLSTLMDVSQFDPLILSSNEAKGEVKTGFMYPGVSEPVPFVMNDFPKDLAEKTADLLLNDVFFNGELVLPSSKVQIISQYIRLSIGKDFEYNANTGTIKIDNQQVSSDKEIAKSQIVDFLTRSLKNKVGDEEITFNNKLYYSAKNIDGNLYNFNLTPIKDGLEISVEQSPYKDWVFNNATSGVKVVKGVIREENAYIGFTVPVESYVIASKKMTDEELAAFNKEQSEKQKSKTVEQKGLSDTDLSELSDLLTRRKMTDFEITATPEQVAEGKTWYDTTEITFKDANGKVVKKKLSEIAPYTTMFAIANSNGNVRATFTRAGVTLYQGSDYSDLYHEAWHVFTQLFLTGKQKLDLYNDLKSLGETISYYDNGWKTMNSSKLDFNNINHILYAEEHLAEKFREYQLGKYTPVSSKQKSIFRVILDAIKSFFGFATEEEALAPGMRIGEVFQKLKAGNLTDYTFDQSNIQFNRLNSGIPALPNSQSPIKTLNVTASLMAVDGLTDVISSTIDEFNARTGTNKFTLGVFSDQKIKNVILTEAKSKFIRKISELKDKAEEAVGFEKEKLERSIETLEWVTSQFDVDKPNQGFLKYYNDRTGFFDIKLESKIMDEDVPVDGQSDVDADVMADREGPFAGSGTEFSAKDRMGDAMVYTLSSLFEKTEAGYEYNDLGFRKTVPFNTAFAVIASSTNNALTPEEMYRRLQESSNTKTKNLKPNYKFEFLKQLVSKLGSPDSANNFITQRLWGEFFFAFRLDKQSGIQVTVQNHLPGTKEESFQGLRVVVGQSDSADKAFGRMLEQRFQTGRIKSKYITKNKKTNEYVLDLNKVLEDFPDMQTVRAQPVNFLHALGIDITDNSRIINELSKGLLRDIYDATIVSRIPTKRLVTGLSPENSDHLFYDQNKLWGRLLELESKFSGFNAGYMITNVNGDPQSEMNNPSTAGNQIHYINNAETFAELINNPETEHYSKERSPWVKTSVLFRTLFGNNFSYKNTADGQKVSIEVESLLGTQALEMINNEVIGILKGMKSSASDEQTAYLRDYMLTMLHGASEAFRHADKTSAYVVRLVGGKTLYYVNPKNFKGNLGRDQANKILLGYVASELERIKKVNIKQVTGENASDIILNGGSPGKQITLQSAGSDFVVFHDILTDDLKKDLKNLDVNTVEEFKDLLVSNPELESRIINDLNNYFEKLSKEDYDQLSSYGVTKATGFFDVVKSRLGLGMYDNTDLLKITSQAFTYNSFIHRMEMSTLTYGDPATFFHDKEEHMKRIPGFFATGRIGRTDNSMNTFIERNKGRYHESAWFKNSGYPAPTNTMAAQSTIIPVAVVEDPKVTSVYLGEMLEVAKKAGLPESDFKEYQDMKVADAQSWITFDAYRALEIRFNNWSPYKEELYNKILNGEKISDAEALSAFMPVKKLQYSGPIRLQNYAANAFHKYSLIPLIPTVIQGGTRLESLHNKLVSEGLAYAVTHSGSKIASLGSNKELDGFYTDNLTPKWESPDFKFTKNFIFVNYLKEQLVTKDKFKKEIKFPTQIRKLITIGLTEDSPLVKAYLSSIDKMQKVAENELKMELGYKDAKSRRKGEPSINLTKFVEYIQNSLTAQDLAEQDIDFITIGDDGKFVYPLDLASDPGKIEKIITSIVNKRINEQPVYGEQYIQGSGIGFEKFSKPTENDLIKYGSNGLPFYKYNGDGKNVSAMKVKISLHGKFKNLLKLKHTDNKVIGTIDRLNDMLKDETWLNTGEHRQMVTLIAARIPTQGPNSMEFMEVYEFLPEIAGNIMILPLEIVAKSGGDFDIDKMITMVPGITDNEGVIEIEKPKATRKLLNTILEQKLEIIDEIKEIRKKYIKSYLKPEFQEEIDKYEQEQRDAYQEFLSQWTNNYYIGGATEKYYARINAAKAEIDRLYDQLDSEIIETRKGEFDQFIAEITPLKEKLRELNREEQSYRPKAYQQDVMNSMKNILSRSDNYINLVRPNGTNIYTEDEFIEGKSLVDALDPYNRNYSNKTNKTNPSDGKKMSPTKIMENRYNITKASALNNGKQGVGMLATGNTFHALATLAETTMSPTRQETKIVNRQPVTYTLVQELLLPHNYKIVNGRKEIDFSSFKDADLNKYVRDVVSELMNGYLDVAKKDWVYSINAIKQLEPEFEFMMLAGVPVQVAALMLAQPYVREYLNSFKEYSSPYSVLNPEISLSNTNFAKRQAIIEVLLNRGMDDVFPKDNAGDPNTFINTPALLQSLREQYLQGMLKSNRNALILEKAKLESLEKVTIGNEYEIYFDKSDSTSILTVESIRPKKDKYIVVLKNEKSGKEYTYTVNKFGEGDAIRFEEPVTFIDVISEINDLSKKIADADIELIEAPQGEFPNLVLGDKKTVTLNREIRDENGVERVKFTEDVYEVLVPGHPNVKLYLSKNEYGLWIVEDFYTGSRVSSGSTPAEAVLDAEEKLKKNLSNIKKGDKGYDIAKQIKADIKKLTPAKGKAKASVKAQESFEILFNNENLISNLKKENSNFSKQQFAHFVEIIYMASKLTELKMAIRFDTLKNTSYFEAQKQERGLENILDGAFSKEVIERLLDKTVLKSFRTSNLLKDAIAVALPVRSNEQLNNKLGQVITEQSLDSEETEDFAKEFNDDFMLYLFQNKLYTFNSNTDTYRSEVINSGTASIKEEAFLKFGAFLDVETGEFLVDKAQIIKDFNSRAFSKDGYGGGVKLAKLPESIFFKLAKEKQLPMYYKFVLEREYLRATMPYESTIQSVEFAKFLVQRQLDTDLPMRYEEFIRNKALENLYIDTAFFDISYKISNGIIGATTKFIDILDSHPDLAKSYPVLDIIGVASSGTMRFFKLNDRVSDGTILTSYKNQMNDLADPGVRKVKNDEENLYISQFFAKMKTIAYLQAGSNKLSNLYMMSIFDNTSIADYMAPTVKKIADGADISSQLDDFSERFIRRYKTRGKFVYTNYAGFITQNPLGATPTLTAADAKVKTSSVFLNEDTGEIEPVYQYNEKLFEKTETFVGRDDVPYTKTKYTVTSQLVQKMFELNPDSVYVFEDMYPSAKLDAQGKVIIGERPNKPTQIEQQAFRAGLATGNSFALPVTKQDGSIPNPKGNGVAKDLIDQYINELVALKEAGKTIIFPSNGIGGKLLGFYRNPMGSISLRENAERNTDLYLYLSKQLLEKFGYRNPKFELITKNFNVEELEGKGTGLDFIQEYYKSKGLQRKTDKEVNDYINKCKGIQ
jgi:hypothetical protein